MDPSAPPPQWDPNDSRVGLVIAVTSSVLTVAFVAVALRVYTRAVLLRQFGMDDWATVFAFLVVFACGFCVAWSMSSSCLPAGGI